MTTAAGGQSLGKLSSEFSLRATREKLVVGLMGEQAGPGGVYG